jgi:transposase
VREPGKPIAQVARELGINEGTMGNWVNKDAAAGPAADAGVVLEQAQGVMVAISPIVGSARIASAAGKILRACGVAGAIEEAEVG